MPGVEALWRAQSERAVRADTTPCDDTCCHCRSNDACMACVVGGRRTSSRARARAHACQVSVRIRTVHGRMHARRRRAHLPAVYRVLIEERAGPVAALEGGVVQAALQHQVAHLQPRRPRPHHAVPAHARAPPRFSAAAATACGGCACGSSTERGRVDMWARRLRSSSGGPGPVARAWQPQGRQGRAAGVCVAKWGHRAAATRSLGRGAPRRLARVVARGAGPLVVLGRRRRRHDHGRPRQPREQLPPPSRMHGHRCVVRARACLHDRVWDGWARAHERASLDIPQALMDGSRR